MSVVYFKKSKKGGGGGDQPAKSELSNLAAVSAFFDLAPTVIVEQLDFWAEHFAPSQS